MATNATIVAQSAPKKDLAYNHDVKPVGADQTVDKAALLGFSTSANTDVDYVQVSNKAVSGVIVVTSDGASTEIEPAETRTFGNTDGVALSNDFSALVLDGGFAVFSWNEI